MHRFIALGCLTIPSFWVCAADEKPRTTTIELGGLRQARAVLTVSEGDYTLQVRMLPVRCFDESMNARLSREKARELALLALAKHLSGKQNVRLTVRDAQVEKAAVEGKFYLLWLRVPRKNVSLEAVAAAPVRAPDAKHGVEQVTLKGGLFTRKRDYQDLVRRVFAAVEAEIALLEARAKDPPKGTDFFTDIADIEEKGTKWFDRLTQEVQDDILLLDEDQEELNRLLATQKKQVLTLLREAVQRYEAQPQKEKP